MLSIGLIYNSVKEAFGACVLDELKSYYNAGGRVAAKPHLAAYLRNEDICQPRSSCF